MNKIIAIITILFLVSCKTNVFNESKISTLEINVNEVNYSRNIDGQIVLEENRKTDTKYSIDFESKKMTVKFSDGTDEFFDSLQIKKKNQKYEILFQDSDKKESNHILKSMIVVDLSNNSIEYIEKSSKYKNDFNKYKFVKFEIKTNYLGLPLPE